MKKQWDQPNPTERSTELGSSCSVDHHQGFQTYGAKIKKTNETKAWGASKKHNSKELGSSCSVDCHHPQGFLTSGVKKIKETLRHREESRTFQEPLAEAHTSDMSVLSVCGHVGTTGCDTSGFFVFTHATMCFQPLGHVGKATKTNCPKGPTHEPTSVRDRSLIRGWRMTGSAPTRWTFHRSLEDNGITKRGRVQGGSGHEIALGSEAGG